MTALHFPTSLGLDIHDDYVAMTLMKKSLMIIEVMDGGYFEIPSQKIVENPELESRFTKEIKQFLAHKNYRPKHVCLSLPRSMFFIESFDIPAPPKKKFLHSMIEFELEKHFFAGLKEFYFSYHLNQLENNQYRVTSTGLKKKSADYFLHLIHGMNMVPHLLTAPTLANANLVFSEKATCGRLLAVVDLGPRNAEIIIVKNQLIEYSRLEPLADEVFGSAYFLRIEEDEQARSRASEVSKKIIEKILEGLAYSNNIEESESLNRIILIGGGALAENIAENLQKESGVPTVFPDIPKEINPRIPKSYQANFLNTSLALASHPFRKNDLNVNLLPSSSQPGEKKTGLGSALVLSAIALLFYLGIMGYQILQKQNQIAQLDNQLKEVKKQAGVFEKVDLEYEALKKRLGVFQTIEKKYPQKLPVLKELSDLLPKNTWLTNMRFKYNQLEIKGFSSSASELVPILEKSPMFEEVSFSGAIVRENKLEKFSLRLMVAGNS